MSRILIIALGAVAALALAGGGFVTGMNVGAANAASAQSGAPRNGAGRQFQGQGQGANAQVRPLAGQVLSVNDGSVTLQLGQEQGSRIVLVAPSTRVVKTTETDVPLSSVRAGDRVTVIGQENSDGTVSAQSIVVGGNLGQLFGGARPSPSP